MSKLQQKFDVTGHCWLVALSNYSFKIYNRFKKIKSRRKCIVQASKQSANISRAVKAVFQTAEIDWEILPIAESFLIADTCLWCKESPELALQE